jgi:hypothetical protein
MAKFEITWLEDRSDEALLAEIRRVAALQPDYRLTQRAFDARSKVSATSIRRRFGSWSEATRRAGLTTALPVYSDAEILEDLKRVSGAFQNVPFTRALYSEHGRYSADYARRRFGGWREALDVAGIGNRFVGPPTTERMKTQPSRSLSEEDILEKIRTVSAQLGKAAISGAEIVANSNLTQSQLFRRFGGVSAALRKAGVEQVSHGRRHTEDEVFENLLGVWTHYGRPPTVAEMDLPPSTIGKNTYLHRYGGWRRALKAFVERANSEVAAESTPDLDRGPPSPADGPVPTETTLTSANGMGGPQPVNPSRPRVRATTRMPANVNPEDRRDPTIGLRFKVLQRDRFKCVLCGDHPARNSECRLHVDHVIPWSKGGKTREDNLRTLCATCNIGRGNRFDE